MQPKPLIQLKNIGKIYASEGNVAVGIRGVNLSFTRGEFVAVTGASGSGKSTLLNVISGMDSYEEGELLIDGEPTSHYIQKDWETYREEYISFIFQDYNIIESFTVLQNVELALLHIGDPKARRERAMELIRRVGLEKHIKHKGSKLSGGQKQRTVIARALAKDSPVILADEPTGNLDSQSSREIIELLREVSEDKLVIIVTHNFDEVEHCATRHIRVFDGAVELDHTVRPAATVRKRDETPAPLTPPPAWAQKTRRILRDGLHLGRIRFSAMPKLSVFLCCLMTLTALITTFVTAAFYDATELLDDPSMFTHVDGRVVIAREDGRVITEDELAALKTDIGAADTMHYDFLLDRTKWIAFENDRHYTHYEFAFAYPASEVRLDAGRYPERDNEIVLEAPVSLKRFLGTEDFEEYDLPLFDMATYRVVGVRYYYDNTRTSRMLFTENGYKVASALAFFGEQKRNFGYELTVSVGENFSQSMPFYGDTHVDFNIPPHSYYLNLPALHEQADIPVSDMRITASLRGSFTDYTNTYDYYDYGYGDVWVEEEKPGLWEEKPEVVYDMAQKTLLSTLPVESRLFYEKTYYDTWKDPVGIPSVEFVAFSPELLTEFLHEHYYTKAYTQASLFFENDRAAHAQIEALRDRGYIAVVSDETVEPDVSELISSRLIFAGTAIGWVISVVFAAMVLALCTSRAMNTTRGDIAIMRSMGIPTAVVRVSIYVQTLISLIPAVLITAIAAVVVYITPATNAMFVFLHAGDYLVLALALVAIAFVLSQKQAAKMFHESVKKTLRGGKMS